ncbi:uncharacterized protein LTR77_009312 [Saxophila tyrrhenica]|uniref:TPR-like protein n=1 Tax=Saxophila tyrrhenica TaxID=1690608 RepID=A0AAV9P0R6_9PEZI|nr:hypothetical protein LTR77_009312 [Saxophila tyrrhenica]
MSHTYHVENADELRSIITQHPSPTCEDEINITLSLCKPLLNPSILSACRRPDPPYSQLNRTPRRQEFIDINPLAKTWRTAWIDLLRHLSYTQLHIIFDPTLPPGYQSDHGDVEGFWWSVNAPYREKGPVELILVDREFLAFVVTLATEGRMISKGKIKFELDEKGLVGWREEMAGHNHASWTESSINAGNQAGKAIQNAPFMPEPPTGPSMDADVTPYFNLGSYCSPLGDNSNPIGQTWFDRGLVWCYAFNHEEALYCFRKAIAEDPGCLMAYWGIAYALGPNYNKPWEIFDAEELERNAKEAREAIGMASRRGTLEGQLIAAVGERWGVGSLEGEGREKWNERYAEAMAEVAGRWPEMLDVQALYADALMNLTPWSLWDLKTGEPTSGSRTLEAKEVLETAMAKEGGDSHPGLLHLYIHLMEMSSSPSTALPAANRLRNLVPDAGHLHHMPTHLDVLCGDYASVVTSNTAAIAADERWVARRGARNFYSLYRAHNYHFKIYGAMFAGQSQTALETAARLEEAICDDLLRVESPPMADWLEAFLTMRLHVLVRFGRWDDILSLDLPEDEELYCVTTAMLHYASAVAYANTSSPASASSSREAFLTCALRVPESRTLFNNTARSLLAVARAMLEGEIAYHAGETATAFHHLNTAVRLSDTLPYDEPWGWMQPPRHALGALLLEQASRSAQADVSEESKAKEGATQEHEVLIAQERLHQALSLYEADLGLNSTLPRALRHPGNVWALSGLRECYELLGRKEEAERVGVELGEKMTGADVEVRGSCYCRKDAERGGQGVSRGIEPWRFNRGKEKDT